MSGTTRERTAAAYSPPRRQVLRSVIMSMPRRILVTSALTAVLWVPWCPRGQSSATSNGEHISVTDQSRPLAEEVERLIDDMSRGPYLGPVLERISPTVWNLHFTKPMLRLLELGPAIQGHLLPRLSDPKIKDQAIMVLGGVGDENAIQPIIE